MKRRNRILLLMSGMVIVFAVFIAVMNYAKLAEFFTAFLAPNAMNIIIVSGGIFILGVIAYKLVKAGEFRLDWWIFKKVGIGERLVTRDRARQISLDTLEKEYMLTTGLTQMHHRSPSLVCDAVIDTEKERRPFAVFAWTMRPFHGRRHDLADEVENHFDELFIVEVDLSSGYPAVSGMNQKDTFDWLVRKHILSKPREEDAFKSEMQKKIAEGFGFGMGEAIAEKKEVKEGEKV